MRITDRGGGGEGVGCGCRWGGLQDAGCRMQTQVAYKYGSFMHLGKVKKIRNLGCSCPGSDLSFLSRDSDRG